MYTLAQFTILASSDASAAVDAHGEEAVEAASGIATLGINPLAIALQAGTFVILFVLIRKFALKKIVSVLDERHDTIEKGLDDAKKIAAQLEESTVEQGKLLKAARKEADLIIAKAHEETGIMIKEAEDAASTKSDKIIADAQGKIEAEVNRVKKELKSELAGLVAEATEAVIGEKMTDATDKKLIEKALNNG